MFKDRKTAGQLLASELAYQLSIGQNKDEIVLVGIARGGIPVAKEIANTLGTNMIFLVSRKIVSPSYPGLALGAVTSSGITVHNEQLRFVIDALDRKVANERKPVMEFAQQLERNYVRGAMTADINTVKNKNVILVDDGAATGMTALAAITSVKACGAEHVILAAPVISKSAFALLTEECKKIIALDLPNDFLEVGEFYKIYHPVEDSEIFESLKISQREYRIA